MGFHLHQCFCVDREIDSVKMVTVPSSLATTDEPGIILPKGSAKMPLGRDGDESPPPVSS
ncbi:MAG: hypothetical protein KME08_06710 [Aphanothece sp. CMT-3BRIN-NPC111]|nr:hypothetical protein [Aphanothece sp. CMT-3BRIN-NPC111]